MFRMKITRKALFITTISLGGAFIAYNLFRIFTGIGFDESIEKYMMDVLFIAVIGFFVLNRKMANEEKKAKEQAEEEAGLEDKSQDTENDHDQ